MNKICVNFISLFRHSDIYYASATLLGSRTLSYQSDLSVQKLYPNSRLNIYTPPPPPIKDDKFSGYIPMNQLEVTYSRSSGPGGQHVNCVNTKVDVRFKLATADWIPEKTRHKLLKSLENRITKEGYFIIKSDLTRSQQLNLADALEKLRSLIREFEIEAPPPTEETIEAKRRRQEKAARERLMVKRQRAQVKADRQGPSINDL